MAVIKRKNTKNYYIKFRRHGKQIMISAKTTDRHKAEMQELLYKRSAVCEYNQLNDIVKNIAKLRDDNPKILKSGLHMDDIWNAYLEQPGIKERRKRTINDKYQVFLRFREWLKEKYPGIRYVHEIDKYIANEYAGKLIADGKSGKTYGNIKTALRSVFQAIRYRADIDINVWDFIPSVSKKTIRTHRTFTDEEISGILKAADKTWKKIITIGLYTGLRFSDICNLKFGNFDFTEKLLVLVPSKTQRFSTRVVIPIHQKITRIMNLLPKIYKDDEYLFPEFSEDKHRNKENSRRFGKIMRKAGIEFPDGYITDFGSLRHTFNTRLESAGVAQETRIKLTGHTNLKTNEIYSHAVDPLRDAMKKLK